MQRKSSISAELWRARILAIVSLAIVTPAGFAMKFYSGPAADWFNNSAGGAMYVVFWCLLAAIVWPRRSAVTLIVITVLTVTCILETMQLWKAPPLQWVRSFFIGRTLIGTTFSPSDYIYYFAGALIGWFWLRLIAAPDENK